MTPIIKLLLYKDQNGKPRVKSWNYRLLIRILTYLQRTTHLDISMAVYQCARFLLDLKLIYKRVITRLDRYLIETKDYGLIYKMNKEKCLECYVDADFAGG